MLATDTELCVASESQRRNVDAHAKASEKTHIMLAFPRIRRSRKTLDKTQVVKAVRSDPAEAADALIQAEGAQQDAKDERRLQKMKVQYRLAEYGGLLGGAALSGGLRGYFQAEAELDLDAQEITEEEAAEYGKWGGIPIETWASMGALGAGMYMEFKGKKMLAAAALTEIGKAGLAIAIGNVVQTRVIEYQLAEEEEGA